MKSRYTLLIGTGGIGAGSFFALNGDHTLGREESRSGRYVDRRDYCKLHIIAQTTRQIAGEGLHVVPIGAVGDDAAGRDLLEEMLAHGLDIRHVRRDAGRPTLRCLCLMYPDGSGGNLTVDDSASAQVSPEAVFESAVEFAKYREEGIALAVPEVPLAARVALLDWAGAQGFFRVASFTSAEMKDVRERGLMELVDHLAINLDEGSLWLGEHTDALPWEETSARVLDRLRADHPFLGVSLTCGANGSWTVDAHSRQHLPALPVSPVSAAGAGDAHLSGILAGLAAGMSLSEAHYLGRLAGAFSVLSPHTIAPGIGRQTLLQLGQKADAKLPENVFHYLTTSKKDLSLCP